MSHKPPWQFEFPPGAPPPVLPTEEDFKYGLERIAELQKQFEQEQEFLPKTQGDRPSPESSPAPMGTYPLPPGMLAKMRAHAGVWWAWGIYNACLARGDDVWPPFQCWICIGAVHGVACAVPCSAPLCSRPTSAHGPC